MARRVVKYGVVWCVACGVWVCGVVCGVWCRRRSRNGDDHQMTLPDPTMKYTMDREGLGGGEEKLTRTATTGVGAGRRTTSWSRRVRAADLGVNSILFNSSSTVNKLALRE